MSWIIFCSERLLKFKKDKLKIINLLTASNQLAQWYFNKAKIEEFGTHKNNKLPSLLILNKFVFFFFLAVTVHYQLTGQLMKPIKATPFRSFLDSFLFRATSFVLMSFIIVFSAVFLCFFLTSILFLILILYAAQRGAV